MAICDIKLIFQAPVSVFIIVGGKLFKLMFCVSNDHKPFFSNCRSWMMAEKRIIYSLQMSLEEYYNRKLEHGTRWAPTSYKL